MILWPHCVGLCPHGGQATRCLGIRPRLCRLVQHLSHHAAASPRAQSCRHRRCGRPHPSPWLVPRRRGAGTRHAALVAMGSQEVSSPSSCVVGEDGSRAFLRCLLRLLLLVPGCRPRRGRCRSPWPRSHAAATPTPDMWSARSLRRRCAANRSLRAYVSEICIEIALLIWLVRCAGRPAPQRRQLTLLSQHPRP